MAPLQSSSTTTPSPPEKTRLSVKDIKVESSSSSSSPPKGLYFVIPTIEGTYPVLVFFPGTLCLNHFYSQLLQLISSRGFIVVAPQCSLFPTFNQWPEIKSGAEVIDWLPKGLQSFLPDAVQADLSRLVLSGHSRGGKTAFCLALGLVQTSLKYSALIGIDPVAGLSQNSRTEPQILNYVPRSFNMDGLPVAVIGTGLGSEKVNILLPPCAPEGVNHSAFFAECQPPCCHFVASEYGHLDLLDTLEADIGSCICKSGKGPKELLREGIGDIISAFLRAYLDDDKEQLHDLVNDPNSIFSYQTKSSYLRSFI